MLTYSLENRKNETLYEYFYNCLKNDILNGVLRPDEKLPSKRAFASNHGVSVITVENTYGQLMAEGYIYSKAKSGFYVSHSISDIQGQFNYRQHFDIDKNEYVDSYTSEIAIENNKREDFINLTSNHTNKDYFPFSVWAKLNRQILSDENENLLTPPPMGGAVELRQAIAKHLHDFRGIDVSYEQIIIGAGTEYLYNLIVQLLGRDKIYGLENPGSKKIRSIYEALGVKVAPLKMDNDGIELTPENLTLPDIIQLSPSHHFPTGIVTPVNRRYGLLQWANEVYSRYLIEDDYDSEFRLQGKPIPSLFSMDTTDKVIYLNTFTKSLASTIRISYMVLPKTLLTVYKQKLSFYSCTVSNFEQYILAAFINENHFEKHINRMRNHYRSLRDSLINTLKTSRLNSFVKIDGENSGLHFLMHIDSKKSDQTLKNLAANEGILISFLSEYLSHDYGNCENKYLHTAIINYSGLSEDMIGKAVAALERAWG